MNKKPKIYIDQEVYNKIQDALSTIKTEFSAFGIIESMDPIKIVDLYIPKQECSMASTDMDDDDVANFIEDWTDEGWQPWQLQRVWIHTHPSGVANPSSTDYDTFERCFGSGDWGVMMIFAKSGEIVCDVHINEPLNMTIKAELVILHDKDHEFIDELKSKITEQRIILPHHGKYLPPYGFGHYSSKYNKNTYIGKETKDADELLKKKIQDMTDAEYQRYSNIYDGWDYLDDDEIEELYEDETYIYQEEDDAAAE